MAEPSSACAQPSDLSVDYKLPVIRRETQRPQSEGHQAIGEVVFFFTQVAVFHLTQNLKSSTHQNYWAGHSQ